MPTSSNEIWVAEGRLHSLGDSLKVSNPFSLGFLNTSPRRSLCLVLGFLLAVKKRMGIVA